MVKKLTLLILLLLCSAAAVRADSLGVVSLSEEEVVNREIGRLRPFPEWATLAGIPTVPTDIVCTTTGQFASALTSSVQGDTITLTAGNTFTGPFYLPNKGTVSQYITIRSSALASLPAAGIRVFPSDAANMPKIVTPGVNVAAIYTNASASYYKLIGLEILPTNSSSIIDTLVHLGDDSNAQDTLAEVPHHLTIDRCYIHAWPTQSLKRGIGLHSATTDIINSYISSFKSNSIQDTQAILAWNGPGPYNIINNYLESAGENVMLGGVYHYYPEGIPSDVLIQHNHFRKPPSWYVNDPSWDGSSWIVKNLFEIKGGRRVTIEGNIFEYSWQSSQVGFAILFTPSDDNSDGIAYCDDVLFTNNLVRHAASGVQTKFYVESSQRISLINNLFYDISSTWNLGIASRFILVDSVDDFVINHNTGIHDGESTTVLFLGNQSPRFIYTNNITGPTTYGMFGNGVSSGSAGIAAYAPGYVVLNNMLAGAPSGSYPANNFYPSLLSDALFTNSATNNYRLQSGSPYHAPAGTDSADVGVNLTTLNTAIGASSDNYSSATFKVITGNWTGAPAVPADPSSLTATDASSSQINLSWTDNSSDETGFRIERCTGAACSSFAEIATVGADVTTYPNTGLSALTLYRYRVRAYNGTGNSGYSNTAEDTTPASGVAPKMSTRGRVTTKGAAVIKP